MTSHTRSSGLAGGDLPVEQFSPPATTLFLLTLCRLNAPVSLPKPSSPHLARYSFFMSRSRDRSGAERLLLHIGYFQTRAEAEQCLRQLQTTYPKAIISTRSVPISQNVPTLRSAAHESGASVTATATSATDPVSAANTWPLQSSAATLTDTQVLRILEIRSPEDGDKSADSPGSDISLSRPEDTETRRALKEAVAANAPVHFAVQLLSSAQPIDLAGVPRMDVFRSHALYFNEVSRDGRKSFFLRLGFFSDAVSARQVAHFVRHKFPAVVVVPVLEQERERANQTRIDRAAFAAAAASAGTAASRAQRSEWGSRTSASGIFKGPMSIGSKRSEATLEQTLEMLAASEIFNDDSTSDTGVRHLSITVKKRIIGRS